MVRSKTKANKKTIDFRLPSVAQKRLCLSSPYGKSAPKIPTKSAPLLTTWKQTTHNSLIRSDEGLTLETSALESFYGGHFIYHLCW